MPDDLTTTVWAGNRFATQSIGFDDTIVGLQGAVDSGQQSLPISRWCRGRDGRADQASQLQAAITAAEGDGRALCIPQGTIIRCDSPLTAGTGPLTIFGGGKILVPAHADGCLEYAPALGTARTVSAQSNVADPYANQLSTRLTLSAGIGDFVAGDVVYIHSAQGYAYEATTDRAEIATVLRVDTDNTHLYLHGLLAEDYLPGTFVLQVYKMSSHRLIIDGLVFEGRQDLDDNAVGLRSTLAVTGCVNPQVRARFNKLAGRGFVALGCFGGDFQVEAFDLKDDATNSYYGYGATAMGATRNCLFNVRARRVRHAFTTNVYTRNGFLLWDSGAPRENRVTGQAYNCTSAAWDTHSGAYDTEFENIKAYWPHQVDDDASGAGRQYALQDRACGTMVRGLTAIGGMNGLILSGQATAYGRDNITVIDGAILRNASGDNSRVALNIPADTEDAGDSAFNREIHISRSWFEWFGSVSITASAAELFLGSMGTVTFFRQKQIRPGGATTIALVDVHRMHKTGDGDESFRLLTGMTVRAYNYKVRGDTSQDAFFFASGTGSCTLYYGTLQSERAEWTRMNQSGAALVVTETSMNK